MESPKISIGKKVGGNVDHTTSLSTREHGVTKREEMAQSLTPLQQRKIMDSQRRLSVTSADSQSVNSSPRSAEQLNVIERGGDIDDEGSRNMADWTKDPKAQTDEMRRLELKIRTRKLIAGKKKRSEAQKEKLKRSEELITHGQEEHISISSKEVASVGL